MRAFRPTAEILWSPWSWVLGGWVLRRCRRPQGSGRYSIYIANYASGNVGPHALIEMDVAASDPARGIVVLVDVAVQAGVSKYTGTRLLQPCGGDRAQQAWDPVASRAVPVAGSGLCHALGCLTAPSSGSPMARGRDQGQEMLTQDPRLLPGSQADHSRADSIPRAGSITRRHRHIGRAEGNMPGCAPRCPTTAGTAAVPRLPSSKLSLIRSVVTMVMAVIGVGSDTSGCQAQLASDERV